MENQISWLEVQATLKEKVLHLEQKLRKDSDQNGGEIGIKAMSLTMLMLALSHYTLQLQALPVPTALSNLVTQKMEAHLSFVSLATANLIMSSCVHQKTWTSILPLLPPITLKRSEVINALDNLAFELTMIDQEVL